MTLGGAAAAQVRLTVWCRECSHQAEPDPAEIAARFAWHYNEVQRAPNCLANSLLG
jgi:hypothetical protein